MKHRMQVIWNWFSSFFSSAFGRFSGKAWWVRIRTEQPNYTYYFGPFPERDIAQQKRPSFVEDLQSERASVSSSSIEWCKPTQITIPES